MTSIKTCPVNYTIPWSDSWVNNLSQTCPSLLTIKCLNPVIHKFRCMVSHINVRFSSTQSLSFFTSSACVGSPEKMAMNLSNQRFLSSELLTTANTPSISWLAWWAGGTPFILSIPWAARRVMNAFSTRELANHGKSLVAASVMRQMFVRSAATCAGSPHGYAILWLGGNGWGSELAFCASQAQRFKGHVNHGALTLFGPFATSRRSRFVFV